MAKKYSATNPRLKAFADRFRKYVDDAGGVNKVSAITGISRVTIGFWYNGERTPDAANMITLAEKTNISVDWFLGLCDERTRDVELKAVCKYTGLSEDAIEILHSNLKSPAKQYDKVINFLLENTSVNADNRDIDTDVLLSLGCFFDISPNIQDSFVYDNQGNVDLFERISKGEDRLKEMALADNFAYLHIVPAQKIIKQLAMQDIEDRIKSLAERKIGL